MRRIIVLLSTLTLAVAAGCTSTAEIPETVGSLAPMSDDGADVTVLKKEPISIGTVIVDEPVAAFTSPGGPTMRRVAPGEYAALQSEDGYYQVILLDLGDNSYMLGWVPAEHVKLSVD